MPYRQDDEEDDDLRHALTEPVQQFMQRYQTYAECEEGLIDGIEQELEKMLAEMNEQDRTTSLTLSRRVPINRGDDD